MCRPFRVNVEQKVVVAMQQPLAFLFQTQNLSHPRRRFARDRSDILFVRLRVQLGCFSHAHQLLRRASRDVFLQQLRPARLVGVEQTSRIQHVALDVFAAARRRRRRRELPDVIPVLCPAIRRARTQTDAFQHLAHASLVVRQRHALQLHQCVARAICKLTENHQFPRRIASIVDDFAHRERGQVFQRVRWRGVGARHRDRALNAV